MERQEGKQTEIDQDFKIRRRYLRALGYALGLKGKDLRDEVDKVLSERQELADVYKKAQNLYKVPGEQWPAVRAKIHELGAKFLRQYELHNDLKGTEDMGTVIGMQVLNLCVEELNSSTFGSFKPAPEEGLGEEPRETQKTATVFSWRMGLITKSPDTAARIEKYLGKHKPQGSASL